MKTAKFFKKTGKIVGETAVGAVAVGAVTAAFPPAVIPGIAVGAVLGGVVGFSGATCCLSLTRNACNTSFTC